jgi:drug/metabolite transporter (DMT)-like permease
MRPAFVFAVIAIWFVLNIMIQNLVRAVVQTGFKFPLWLTLMHMVFSFGASLIFLKVSERSLEADERAAREKERREINRLVIWPLSIAFALSVGTGNLALKYLFPSFNQMLSSIGPLVTLVLDLGITGTKYNFASYVSVTMCVIGVMLCTVGEPSMHVLGLLYNICSTFLRGVKSVLQQILLTDHKIDAITLLYLMAPQAGLVLLPLSLWQEGNTPWLAFWNPSPEMTFDREAAFWLVLLSCLNACFLNVTTFMVTRETSAVTLQVLGNAKTIVGIGVSFVWFGNATTAMQLWGMGVCIVGIIMYERMGKKTKPQKANPLSSLELEGKKPVLPR